MAKVSGLPKLSNIASGAAAAASNRMNKLSKSVLSSLSPSKALSAGFKAVSSKVSSEIPELGLLTNSLGGFLKEIMSGSSKSSMGKSLDDPQTKSNIKKIKSDTEDQTGLFAALIGVSQKIEQNLQNSPSELLSIHDVLEDTNGEIKTLVEITKDAWTLSQEQLDTARAIHKSQMDAKKHERFKEQKLKAQNSNLAPLLDPLKKVEDKKHTVLEKLLEGFMFRGLLAPLAGILAPIVTAVSTLAEASMLGSVLSKTGLGAGIAAGAAAKGAKGLSKTAGPAAKAPGLISKTIGGVGKGVGATAKAGFGIVKGVGRFAGPVALALSLFDGVVGAMDAGVKSYNDGNSTSKIVADTIFGGIKGIATGLIDTVKLLVFELPKFIGEVSLELFKNFGEFVSKNVLPPAIEYLTEKKNDILSFFSNQVDYWQTEIKNFFIPIGQFISDIGTQLSNTMQFLKATTLNNIKDFINMVIEALPMSANIKKLLPDSAKEFLASRDVVPPLNSTIIPSVAKVANQAADMLVGQKSITEKEIGGRGFYGPMGNNLPSLMNMPVTQTVNNTNVISGNIHTRNPEPPSFFGNKIGY